MLKGEKKLKRINIVVPIYNDFDAFQRLIDNVKNYLFLFNYDVHFNIVDDTPNYEIENIIEKNKLSSIMKYNRGVNNYGGSVVTGILRSGKWNKLILMDVDHPFYLLPEIISLLDVNDMIIGNDINSNDERKVTKWLLRNLLGINIPHPTCGYMGFNKDILGNECLTDKTIKFFNALSNGDMVHVEFLYMCMKKKLSIGIIDFDTSNTNIKHNYNFVRNLKWLKDLLMTVFMDRVFNWYE
jgi:hypothetical protein